jgi:hypothetical protein
MVTAGMIYSSLGVVGPVQRPHHEEQGVCQLLACTSIHQIQSCLDFLQSISAAVFGAGNSRYEAER